MILIPYTEAALKIREAINVAVAVFAFVLCALLARYVIREFRDYGYRQTSWEAELSIGLLFIFAGEFLRSTTIWEILHFEGVAGTYLSDVAPLFGALILIVVGALCSIRVMTPVKWGNSVWLGSLVVVLGLIAASRFL